jgi:NADH kinase
VHPSVQSLLLTPICPRSLSFRTVLLPSDSNIQLKVSRQSRSSADVIVDGREIQSLLPGQFLQVAMSPFPIPCINRSSTTSNLRESPSSDPHLIEEADGLHSSSASTQVAQSERGEDDWVRDINTLLRFNASFSGRGLLGGKGAYEENDDK